MENGKSLNFWKNKKVLITGHNGFKGTWLSIWLNYKSAKVVGFSLKPKKNQKLYIKSKIENKITNVNGDIKDKKKLYSTILKYKPNIIFHLAAQPIVIDSYKNSIETIETNLNGTLNLLEVCKNFSFIKSILIITSDKCYENNNNYLTYSENDKLGGLDPYSCSKSLVEILVRSYQHSFYSKINNAALATARCGNVIGGGDLSNYRLVPDIINSFKQNKNLYIRNPKAIRPWLHVLDSIDGYLLLSEQLTKFKNNFSGSWNFGPKNKSIKNVYYIANKFKENWYKKINSKIKIKNNSNFIESNSIKLNINKSKKYLYWKPKLNLDNAIKFTIDWYKENENLQYADERCIKQIKEYEKIK